MSDGKFYEQQGGHSVMVEDNTDRWDPWEVTESDALDTMIEWEEHEHDQTEYLTHYYT